MTEFAAISVFILIAIIMLRFHSKSKRPFKSWFWGLITGVTSLGIIWALSNIFHFDFALNLFTAAIALLLGIPGVVFICAFSFIMI